MSSQDYHKINFSPHQLLPPGYEVWWVDGHYQWFLFDLYLEESSSIEFDKFKWKAVAEESVISADRWSAYRGAWEHYLLSGPEPGRDVDISECITEKEKIDRRKLGRKLWPCGHRFNPYYQSSFKEGKWDWRWVGDSHKEPSVVCEVSCPKCGKEFYFTIKMPQ
jgi:hypothetical protein